MLIAEFWKHATAYYGEGIGELSNYRDALRALRDLLGPTPAAELV